MRLMTMVSALLAIAGTSGVMAMDDDSFSTKDKNVKALENVPVKVKDTVIKEAMGHEIRSVDRETEDGRVVYQAKIQRDGRDLKITVGEDGKVISRNDARVGGDAQVRRDIDHNDHANHGDGDADAHDATVADLPAKAKAVIEKEAAGKEIVDVDRGDEDGRAVYKIRIKQEGLDRRITVDADGNILSDRGGRHGDDDSHGAVLDRDPDGDLKRDARSAKRDADERIDNAKAKADRDVAKAKAEAKADADYAKHRGEKQMAEGKKTLDIEHVPAAVKATLTREADGQRISDIDRDTEDGRVVYQAKIKVADGPDRKIKVAEDGTLVSKRD
jgi:uncharacterized membrane protein YkoI